MEPSTASDETLLVLVWGILIIGILFAIPIWLMFRHHKKSTVKIAKLKKEEAKLSPAEAKKQWHDGHKRALRTVCVGGGAFLGFELFNVIGAVVLASVFGLIGSVIANLVWSDKEEGLLSKTTDNSSE